MKFDLILISCIAYSELLFLVMSIDCALGSCIQANIIILLLKHWFKNRHG